MKQVQTTNTFHLQEHWPLGFLGIIGLWKLPEVWLFIQGDGSPWSLANLLWLLWLLYFLPEEKASSTATITVQDLSRKWKLTKYTYFIFSETPSERDKNDYLHLHPDMSFDSILDGERDTGRWRWNGEEKRVYLYKKEEKGEAMLNIEEVSQNQLVFTFDDPADQEAKNVKIYARSS